jgi:hypothetical protein
MALPRGIDRRGLAEFVLTTMEGAVMQARTHRDVSYFDRAVAQLRAYFTLLGAPAAAQRARRATPTQSRKTRKPRGDRK